MQDSSFLRKTIHRIESLTLVRAVRNGLVSMIPVLVIGAFALILITFPVDGYQWFLTETAFGKGFASFFNFINKATFGVLGVYMAFSISRSYMKIKADPEVINGGAIFASLISFFLLTGSYLEGFSTDNMGPKSMFLAILAGLGASSLYLRFDRLFRRRIRLFSSGADKEFNRMLATFIPIALTVLIVAAVNLLVTRIFDVESFHALIIRMFNGIFSIGKVGFFKGLFFVLFASILWFFGIHGSDALEGVMQTYFAPGLEANQAAVAAGEVPTAILSKQFFDVFVLMGGCGSTICLLIAILAFSRNRAHRGLGLTATLPMIFNINELMVFGLPIIFNPIMVIPFLLVPMICFSLAFFATSIGLVPVIVNSVEWTTPILLGGYQATGSVAGLLMQLVNVIVGVLVYLPFVRILDREAQRSSQERFDEFMVFFKNNEQDLANAVLIDRGDRYGDMAKSLAADLRHDLDRYLEIFYQPQYAYDGKCVGVEALMRWKHPYHGYLYPPLVVKLAGECGLLPELEEKVLRKVLDNRPQILERFGTDIKISVNVTALTVVTPRYLKYVQALNEAEPFAGRNICLEVTEQMSLSLNDGDTRAALTALRGMGLMLAIDDFSMGQTSIRYLQDNLFDLIKLDGALVRGLETNANCKEIISSITELAENLKLQVLAEYVETEDQKNLLHEIGCDHYQGYLFSPAVPLKAEANK